jgi:hypothetical protein
MTIYFGGYPSVYNYSQFVEPKSTASIDLQAGAYTFSTQVYWNNGTTGPTEWFNRTVSTVGYIILEGTTWVKLNLYNAFTGLGLDWHLFNISFEIENAGSEYASDSFIPARFDRNLTIIVRDFFGRELHNSTKVILENNTVWNAPLYVYSVKVTNAQTSIYAKFWIWYSNTSAPYQEYLGCGETQEYFLLDHWYLFGVTNYDSTGITGTTVTFVRFIHQASYYIISDGLIEEILNVAIGVQSRQKVITDLLDPSVVTWGYQLPVVPGHITMSNSSLTIPLRYVADGNTIETKSGTYIWFNSSAPSASSVTTRTILIDRFFLTGNVSTAIRVNTSSGINVINASILPSSFSLNGSDYTVWTNHTISITRELWFRFSDSFHYDYYPNGNPLGANAYIATIDLHNPSDLIWSAVGLFIPFENTSSSRIDNRSVKVFDINNTIYLVESVNYAMAKSGCYFLFTTLANDSWRGLRVSYTTVNDNRFPAPPHVIVTKVGDENGMTRQWQSMLWYFATASWTNTYRESYSGPLYIEMQTSIAMDSTQDVIVQTSTGYVVTTAIVSGSTITIPEITLAVGDSISYTILFKSTAGTGGASSWSFAGIPLWVYASIVGIMTFFIACFMKFARKMEKDSAVFLTISVIAWLVDFLLIVSSFVIR